MAKEDKLLHKDLEREPYEVVLTQALQEDPEGTYTFNVVGKIATDVENDIAITLPKFNIEPKESYTIINSK